MRCVVEHDGVVAGETAFRERIQVFADCGTVCAGGFAELLQRLVGERNAGVHVALGAVEDEYAARPRGPGAGLRGDRGSDGLPLGLG